MNILLTGATGLIGNALGLALTRKGHKLFVLARNPDHAREKLPFPAEIHAWRTVQELPDLSRISSLDAVVHLAGEPIAGKRWSREQKQKITDSRVLGTRSLIQSLLPFQNKGLTTFISASAIGYYGDRLNEPLSEDSEPGFGFLADVCKAWEKEIFENDLNVVRKLALRIGLVLAREGGALETLRPIFLSGAGGPLGSGHQWMSWIHIDDLVRLIELALENERAAGPLNAVAPEPVRNRDFAKIFGRVIERPAILPTPAAAMKLALGEMSSLVLASQRVLCEKAQILGFQYNYPHLEAALKDAVNADLARAGEFEVTARNFIARPIEEISESLSQSDDLKAIMPSAASGKLKPPYKKWKHTQSLEALQGGTLIYDRIVYKLHGGAITNLLMHRAIERDAKRSLVNRTNSLRQKISQ